MIVDSHCHLDDKAFRKDRDEAMTRAREAGVGIAMTIGTGNGPPELDGALRLAREHDWLYATAGVHPHHADRATPATLPALQSLLADPKALALGEIGLDYFYDNSPREVQQRVFIQQMALAAQLKKPIVIHTRDAWDDTLRLLAQHWAPTGLGGILHCFTGDLAHAQRGLDMGFHISFSGVLTYKRSDELRQTAAQLPLDRLLVETDAPYLSPEPYRSKKIRRNEPAFVVETAKCLAECHGQTPEETAATTAANFFRLFQLPVPDTAA